MAAHPGISDAARRLGDVEVPMFSLRLAVVSTILMFAIACGSSSPATAPSPTPSPAPTPGGASSSVSIPVGAAALAKRAYMPDDLDVAVGTTVTWMNTD